MKAVLVVCEGHHDVEFATRSLGAHSDCVFKGWGDRPLYNLPSPFGQEGTYLPKGLIVQSFQARSMASFSTAIRPPVPQFEKVVYSKKDDVLYLLIQAGGDSPAAAVIDLLGRLDDYLSDPYTKLMIRAYAVAFIYDADVSGKTARLQRFESEYSRHFGELSGITCEVWTKKTVPVGVLVYPGTTLEDHIGPMFQTAWPTTMHAAGSFIDGHRAPTDWSAARRWKATITAAGQFRRPGSPMTSMLSRDLLPANAFRNSSLAKTLATFLTSAW